MEKDYKEAFTEIYEIFTLMPEELINKIPSKFYKMIEEERDTNYSPNIKEPLEEQTLKNETIIILGLIYRDFLCGPEERRRLQEADAKELQKAQKELEEKYDIDNIFKTRKESTMQKIENTEEKALTVVEEKKWYTKLFELIKKFFNK